MSLKGKLNLELAWKRYKRDLKELSFSDNPFEVEIIDDNFRDWVTELNEKLENYNPSRSEIINLPKKDYHLRLGTILTSEDATVFHALLLSEIDKIRTHLEWNAGKGSCAHILKEDQSTHDWFTNQFLSWSDFRNKSVEACNSGYEWVVLADISAFFENVSVSRLKSDLEDMGLSKEITTLLTKCLLRWSEPRSRGIPQGNNSSFILAEVYLNSIDKRLSNSGIKYYRYVDDIRIFADSKEKAVEALHQLTILLREKELNLNTGKTYICESEKALQDIDSINGIINDIEEQIGKKFDILLDYYSGYIYAVPNEDVPEDDVPLDLIKETFDRYIRPSFKFDRSLFHYCINKFGASKDIYGVDFCLEAINNRPEEFEHILPYFTKLEDKRESIGEEIIDSLKSSSHFLIIERHYFLLLRWLYNNDIVSEKILHLCRNVLSRYDFHVYTRHYAMAMLGKFGDLSDLDAIEAEYARTKDEITRTVIICSIKRMGKSRRNSMYGRAGEDGQKVKYAIKTCKKND
jgi:retron-type reverse transcriptase